MYTPDTPYLLMLGSETSVEIRFPSSGLNKLNYTNHFPPPPLAATAEEMYRAHTELETDVSANGAHFAWARSELEHGWYYYLADIAARRILQRVITSFYETSESAWLDASIQSILQTAEELDRQLREWFLNPKALIGLQIIMLTFQTKV